MGLLDSLKQKKNAPQGPVVAGAVVAGTYVPMAEIPDEAFAALSRPRGRFARPLTPGSFPSYKTPSMRLAWPAPAAWKSYSMPALIRST